MQSLPHPRAEVGHEGAACGHATCLFERHCLTVQAEVELDSARAERAHRRRVALLLCAWAGLHEDVAAVAEVAMYSGSMEARIRAGELLQDELLAVSA